MVWIGSLMGLLNDGLREDTAVFWALITSASLVLTVPLYALARIRNL